jgi:folate-binding protein YgfZ
MSVTGATGAGVIQSPSVLLGRLGAVAADPPDAGVAAHYGDPLREQTFPAGLVDRSHREVVTVTGPDRLSWLHTLTSQHLSELAPGVGIEALILSPHGHVEHHLALVDDGETTWIDVEPGAAAELVTYLDRMRFMLRVEVARDSSALLTAVGEGVDAALPALVRDGFHAHQMPWGIDLLVPRADVDAVAHSLELPLEGHSAFEAERVAARRPRLGFESDHRTIPNELPWLDSAVHLQKGCYRGQETVARTHNLGRPPRRLVLLHLDGALPERGAPVLAAERTIGWIGTPAYHAELGPIALAVIKRNVPDDQRLVAGGIAASIDAA